MELDVARLSQAERYKLLVGCVVPRPIAFVSTVSVEGKTNLAPFSFFNAISAEPMCLVFSPANKPDGSEKDTLRNAKPRDEGGTGEFVVNAAVEDYARQLNATAEELPWGESEFALAGLTPAPSSVVAAPRVLEAPWSMECRTRQVIRLAPGKPGGGNLVVGEVVHVAVSERILLARMRIDPRELRAIGRLAGDDYSRTREIFSLPRGREALSAPDGFLAT